MADDQHQPQSDQKPFRQDLTYQELRALLDGATLDEVLGVKTDATVDQAMQDMPDAPQSDADSAIEVVEVPDPFVKTKSDLLSASHNDEQAAKPLNATRSASNLEEQAQLMAEASLATYAPDEISVERTAVEERNERRQLEKQQSASSRMLRGSLWMTIGGIASRILGALYIIPWVAMIGATYSTSANSLYAQGYQIYSVFLIIATAGLPNVLSRLVAEYHEKNQLRMVRKVYHSSLWLGAGLGIVGAGLLYILAPLLSQGHANVVPVLHALAAAVLIIPILSMLRGYVQGFEFMGISALSQFIEQLVRVIYMLGMTYWIMIAGHGDWVDATVQSTLGAFWGALAGILVLLIGIVIRKRTFAIDPVEVDDTVAPSAALLGRMARQSLPIVLAGSAISLVQVIDQYTFFHIMRAFSSFSYGAIDNMFAQFSFNSNKLVMLVVSLAVAMSETALPMLARARTTGDKNVVAEQIGYALKLLAFVMLPATLGLAAVARPMYILFYGASDLNNGVLILQYAAYTAIALGMYMVVLAILQGVGDLRYTIRLLGIIVIVKLILQTPLTIWLAGIGPLMATIIAFAVGLVFAIRRLNQRYPISWQDLSYPLMTMLTWSVALYLVVWPVVSTLENFVSDTSRSAHFVIVVVGGLLGTVIYGLATLRTTLGREMFGVRADALAQRLHIK